MIRLMAAAAMVLVACETPPPIVNGKCLVDRYEKARAVKQTCIYVGYVWNCDETSCDREREAGGERPALPAPTKGGAP